MASKKAAKKDIGTVLRGLASDVETAVGKFNEIHLAHIPKEAPASAWARRMAVEVKHMGEITKRIEQSNDTTNEKEEGQEETPE